MIKNPGSSFDRWTWMNIWQAATTVPNTTDIDGRSLNQQMVDYNGDPNCAIYFDRTSDPEACMTPANTYVPADSQYTAYGFTWAGDILMSFDTEEAQSSW